MYTGIQLARLNGMSDPDPMGFGFGVRYDHGKLSFMAIVHGHKWRVTIPVEIVHQELDQVLAENGIQEEPELGERASCNGLFKRIKRAFRKKGLLGRIAKHAFLGPAALAIGKGSMKRKLGRLGKHALLGPAAFVVGEDLDRWEWGVHPDVGRRRRRGGLFGAIKRIGRSVLRVAKKAIQSKALGALVAASAMVMPAIGGPALAALTTARVAMKVIDAAKRGHPHAQLRQAAIARNVKGLMVSRGPASRLALAAFRTNQ
jgi:hypothetical protein